MEVTINGKKANIVMSKVGVLRMFKEATGKDLGKLTDEEYEETDTIIEMVYAAAKLANPDITREDIDHLDLAELPGYDIKQIAQQAKKEQVNKKGPLAQAK